MRPLSRGPTCRPFGFKVTWDKFDHGTPLEGSDLWTSLVSFEFIGNTDFDEICR